MSKLTDSFPDPHQVILRERELGLYFFLHSAQNASKKVVIATCNTKSLVILLEALRYVFAIWGLETTLAIGINGESTIFR